MRIKVHPKLGVLIQPDGATDWVWVTAQGIPQRGRMTEAWASAPGWRELDLGEERDDEH